MDKPSASVRAIFFGSDTFSLPILRGLAERGHEVSVTTAAVVTRPERPAGRGRRLTANPVTTLARQGGIPVLQPERIRDPAAIDELLSLRADLLVVASFGQILPAQLLAAPRFGALNLHPSLLPLYRGPSPIAGSILAGDAVTGTSLMVMTAEMDAGPVISQAEVRIEPGETAGELQDRLAAESADLLMKTLPKWLDGEVTGRAQLEERATYSRRLKKEDGAIDWSLSALELERRIRAFNPWPTAYTHWEGRQLRILRGHIESGEIEPGRTRGLLDGGLAVGTGEGVLVALDLQLAGGKPLAAHDLVRGHPRLLDAQLG